MPDTHHHDVANPQEPYIDAGVMTADVTGDAIDCRRYTELEIDVWWTDAGSPVGVIIIQGSTDGVRWHPLTLTSDMLQNITGDAALNAAGTIDISGVGAGSVYIKMTSGLGSFIRLFYDRTSAGTGDTLSAARSGK